jgi:hypothetical protein
VHRAMIVTATLLILGGVVSFLGIRNPVQEPDANDSIPALPAVRKLPVTDA